MIGFVSLFTIFEFVVDDELFLCLDVLVVLLMFGVYLVLLCFCLLVTSGICFG